MGMGPVESAILVWLAIGAGIAAGVFVVARSAVQIGSVAYRVMEKQIAGKVAVRETALLTLALYLWDAIHGASPARRRDPSWIWQTAVLVVLGVLVAGWNLMIRS